MQLARLVMSSEQFTVKLRGRSWTQAQNGILLKIFLLIKGHQCTEAKKMLGYEDCRSCKKMDVTSNTTIVLDLISYPLECLMQFAGLTVTIFLICIANRLREFHLNLRFLLTIACFLFVTTIVTRLICVSNRWIPLFSREFLNVMVSIHDDAFLVFTVTLLLATFERLLATWSISTYEQRFQSKPYLCFVAVLLFGVAASIEIFVEGGIRRHAVTLFVPIMICLSVTALMINVCSYYLNRRSVGATITAALSHKYQLKENLSALTVLMPISSMWSIVNIVQIICLTVMYSEKLQKPEYILVIKLAAHLFTQVSAIFSLAAPLIILCRHPRFRYRCEMILCRRDRRRLAPPQMSPKAEAEVYFRALQFTLNPMTAPKK